jgi:FKBP-type peptidyl-prolyl cis-trans isomerase
MLLSEGEVSAMLVEMANERRAAKIATTKVLANENAKAGEAFLTENKKKDGVMTLESGLQYKILEAGGGKKPTLEDKVVCHYRGTFIDGTEFDSSYRKNQPATFALTRVIKGWNEALQQMPVGSKWRLFVPPQLAYAERGSDRVGPNATLVFDVELISILDTRSPQQALQSGSGH